MSDRMKMYFLILFVSTFCFFVEAEAPKGSDDFVDFKEIKGLIKSDGLEKIVSKKERAKSDAAKKRKKVRISKYALPLEKDFWSFVSELWLIKNAQVIGWDFKKPDYGIASYFKDFLEEMGYLEVKFKILYVNTPNITHFGLPTNRGEYIFLVSVPFIRALDLSKQEISILLFENYLRSNANYFRSKIKRKNVEKLVGTNFYKTKKIDKKSLDRILKQYDDIVYISGFNPQEQFHITKLMRERLKSNMKLWQAYYRMLQKIDELVKTNNFYQKYSRIYPSPELQLSWLKGKGLE